MKGTSGVMLLPVLDLLTLLIIVLCGLAGFMGILRPEGVISIGELNSKREIVIGAQTKQEELKAIELKVKEQLESLQEDLETLRNAVPTNPTKDSALDQIKQLNDELKRLATLHQKIQTQLPSLQKEIAALSTTMASQQAKLSSLRDTMATEATDHMNTIQSLEDQTLLARKQESELQLRNPTITTKTKGTGEPPSATEPGVTTHSIVTGEGVTQGGGQTDIRVDTVRYKEHVAKAARHSKRRTETW